MALEQVITTYATLGSDFSKATQATRHGSGFAEQFCPLLNVNWWRVVLDESHTVGGFHFPSVHFRNITGNKLYIVTEKTNRICRSHLCVEVWSDQIPCERLEVLSIYNL